MTKKEKEWIKSKIEQIFIDDIEENNDMQTEHAINFLVDLAYYVGAKVCLK